MKGTWQTDWWKTGRKPAFIGDALHVPFSAKKHLWGNMPAIDRLNAASNEGVNDVMNRNVNLLFVASGDLRNVVKTIVGLP